MRTYFTNPVTVPWLTGTGAGKSTVLCLLERFYDVPAGCITIDGHDIKSIDPRWLHRNLVIVPQEPVLFSGTIFSNIAYVLLFTIFEVLYVSLYLVYVVYLSFRSILFPCSFVPLFPCSLVPRPCFVAL
jgi:ABC-type multidrug transport system fused ATPase/permease subunit